jgi:NADH-quinone oxidoreductase subunit C
MALNEQIVYDKLKEVFNDSLQQCNDSLDYLTVEITPDKLYDLIRFLRDDESLRFNFLTTLCGAHYPHLEPYRQIGVIYHLHNWIDNFRIRVKVYLDGENPEVESVTSLFMSANWQERETYDFYGVNFKNHPDLKRILNMDEMVSFPMRKEFPLEDQDRTDKDDRYFGRIPFNKN